MAKVRAPDMALMLQRLQEEEAHVGIVQRVLSAFTLINFVWLCSILGIAVSIGPALFALLRPVYEMLRRLAKELWQRAILPVVRRLHEWCVFELALWGAVGAVALDAHRFYAAGAGQYIATTALALAAPALAYSTVLHGSEFKESPQSVFRWTVGWAACTVAPFAVVYQSSLLGSVTVCCGYYLLGFSAFCCGCCWVFGFDSEDALQRNAAASGILVALVVVTRSIAGAHPLLETALAPFRAACSLWGTFVLMLALLILSMLARLEHYDRRGRHGEKIYLCKNCFPNLLFLVAYLVLKFFGGALSLPGMSNTADVFLVFWAMGTYSIVHTVGLKWNGWALVLLLSVTVWRLALWLNTHPEAVMHLMATV